MKRSNRLLILLGIVLAVIAFGAVLLLNPSGGGNPNATPTASPIAVVVANADIPVGTVLTADMLTTSKQPAANVPANAYKNPQSLVGLIVRSDVAKGDLITGATFQSSQASSVDVIRRLQKGFRAMAVQVDQVTGVGTLLQPGDHVDVVLAMEGADGKFPVVIEKAPSREGTPPTTVRNFQAIGPENLNRTSVKVLVQNAEVLGTLLPPPPAASNQQAATPTPSGATSGSSVSLNGRQQLVILALTPQQVELVRFDQLDGNLSLVLRSTADNSAPPDATTGITLRVLVDNYQVVIPQIVLQQLPPPVGR